MKTKLTALTLVSAVFLSSDIFAQAPVVERASGTSSTQSEQTAAARNNTLEIQALRQEISALRGLVEELSYELRKVKQRQDEDYEDLDRRLAAGGISAPQPSLPVTGNQNSPIASSSQETSEGAEQLYRNGFNALREGDRNGAVTFFEELVETYPGSRPEADSLYWLGETHWLNLEIEKSRQSFTKLLDTYPNYRKVAEARYRLGLIYSQLGEQDKAMEYMRALAEDDNSQSGAARVYLQEQGEN